MATNEGIKLLEEIKNEIIAIRKNQDLYNKELKDYLINYININNKINNKSELLNNNKAQKSEVYIVPPEEQNPWTATGGFEEPTPEFLNAKPDLEREMWALREGQKRNHVTDTDISHLLVRLHTEPSSRLCVEDLRLCVKNWLTNGVAYSAPKYPHQMWHQNKRHDVPYWQSNLDFGRDAKAKAEGKGADYTAFEAGRRKRRSA
ncbi:hypothetical protein CMI37_31180 [Candidatus Pacearchaeota archaeon]|nr:hypothetical protein [Candidatus Pacearchaeota archaeon]|tara:strand:+ start:1616 stop:2227 length:612 start_codon:yes stop_codon:yes gene_type:complete